MREELVIALEERVTRLVSDYQQLQADYAVLQEQIHRLTEGQRLAVARIDALIRKVQFP
jgi:cell division protein FtsB